VQGTNSEHNVMFYGLSTCVWCKRTRQFLEEMNVQFDYVYVDLLQGDERTKAVAEVRRWNKAGSFPTVIVDAAQAIVGFRKDDLKTALGL
jgi:glutaredoxin-like protein NrdH